MYIIYCPLRSGKFFYYIYRDLDTHDVSRIDEDEDFVVTDLNYWLIPGTYEE